MPAQFLTRRVGLYVPELQNFSEFRLTILCGEYTSRHELNKLKLIQQAKQ